MLRRKSPTRIVGESSTFTEDKEDGKLTLSIPVFIRSLEIAREKIKTDDELHVFVEALMDIDSAVLTMDEVDSVFEKYSSD